MIRPIMYLKFFLKEDDTKEEPQNTWRNNTVAITSKRRHFDVITSKWRRFDVITTSLLRSVSAGQWPKSSNKKSSSHTYQVTWIFPGAPWNFNGAPGNIQGSLDRCEIPCLMMPLPWICMCVLSCERVCLCVYDEIWRLGSRLAVVAKLIKS